MYRLFFISFLVFPAFLADLIPPDLADRFHQVANNMKCVENKSCLRSAFLDHLDKGFYISRQMS